MTFKTLKILLCIFILSLCSCSLKRQINYVKTNSTDTLYINKYSRDSIYLKDSIFVQNLNDTIIIDKYHTKYIEKIKLDTIYRSTNDTIIKYEQNIIEKRYVPTIYKWSLVILIILIITIISYIIIKLYLKFK